MMMSTEEEAPRIRIRTPSELFEALEGGEGLVVLGTLNAIGAAPQKALAFGSHDGRDVVDVLVRLSTNGTGSTAGAAVATTLAAFGDSRAQAELMRLWRATDDESTLRAVASALAVRRTPEAIATVRPDLFAEDRFRARLAATVLVDCEDLDARERLRVATSQPSAFGVPSPEPDTIECWSAELDGPCAEDVAELLDTFGDDTVRLFASHWVALGTGARTWTVARSDEVVGRALADSASDVRDAALAALARRGGASAHRDALCDLYRRGDADQRLAVMRAGLDGVDWRAALWDDDVRVRASALRCLARDEGSPVAPEIAIHLADEDWRIRGAATDALRALSEAGVEAARTRLRHDRVEVRYAAAQVLVAAGEWTETEDALLSV